MPWAIRILSAFVAAAIAIWIGGEVRDWFELRGLTAALSSDDGPERERAVLLLLERFRGERLPEWAAERLLQAVVHVEPSVEPAAPAAGAPVTFRCRVRTEHELPAAIACGGIVEIDGKPVLEVASDNVIPPDAPRRTYEVVSAPVEAFPRAGRYTVRFVLMPSSAERRRLGATIWGKPIRGKEISVTVK